MQDYEDLLTGDAADDNLDKSDQTLAHDYVSECTKSKEQSAEFVRIITSNRAMKEPPKKKRKREPVTFAGCGDVDEAEWRKYLPPRCRLYRDNHQKRWALIMTNKHVGKWMVSKSWGPGGDERACVRFCLVKAWERSVAVDGIVCPYDFTDGDTDM